MKYLLLVSHGTMAPGLHGSLRMLLGERDDVLSHSMEDGVSADRFREELARVLEPVGESDSLVVLGDIVGGSPLTCALDTIAEKGFLSRTVAFGGMNLPMAISALMSIDDDLDDESLAYCVISEAQAAVRQVRP